MLEMASDNKNIPHAILTWLYAKAGESVATKYIEETFDVTQESAERAAISANSLRVEYDRNIKEKQRRDAYIANEAERIARLEAKTAAEKERQRLSNEENANITNDYKKIEDYANDAVKKHKNIILRKKYFKTLSNKNKNNLRKTRNNAIAGEKQLLSDDKKEKYLKYKIKQIETKLYGPTRRPDTTVYPDHSSQMYWTTKNWQEHETKGRRRRAMQEELATELRKLESELENLKKNSPGGN